MGLSLPVGTAEESTHFLRIHNLKAKLGQCLVGTKKGPAVSVPLNRIWML